MPPHCDTLDGPVVKAARMALETGNVNLILPWAPEKAERELREAFEKTLHVRSLNEGARELADYWFFETAVRLHREGEGAPYTGLKPVGLDWGPVVPRAERSIEQTNPEGVIHFLTQAVEEELGKRFRRAMSLKNYDKSDVHAAREYVEAMLDFILYSHHLYESVKGWDGHGGGTKEGHEH